MGWWWSSAPKEGQSSAPAASSPPASQPPPETTSAPSQPPQPRTLTREEQADAEWKKLIASLESDITPPSSIAPESLYDDTMSCRSAFDYAFFCQSFGGQFVNVYRYGELRSCSEHWDNFWMCMKTRTLPDQQRRKAIRDHNRKKAIKYKTGPSSEDVWDVRTEPVQNAFSGDFAALEREMQAEEEEAARQKAATA
ncbi:HOOK family protein [Aspergillus niger]|uniref:HOOK family protein n=1 Tax=Aspergillus niger TaxID=5061 RepID=A0A505I9F9_ASPNG|nr:HOOK family protein [Aspergillus niger]